MNIHNSVLHGRLISTIPQTIHLFPYPSVAPADKITHGLQM
uniref:Uncharacterized protein n=1 Tax=Arundo donax TaxID=35708 RepID=A0A0A9FLM2_ARUDO